MSRTRSLAEDVEAVAHLLPAQGPISVFVHHNTLHAFEDRCFEDAVVEAGELFGCEPFASEEGYRAEFARGRISARDVAVTLDERLGARAAEFVGPLTRAELRRRVAVYGIPEAEGPALAWLLDETPALERLRDDLPADAREALAITPEGESEGAGGVRLLWRACERAVRRSSFTARDRRPRPMIRHRDLLRARVGVDVDEWIHPVLIRFVAGYLDQGLAHWPMAGRERGMYACFLDCYGTRLARLCGAWAADLPELLAAERAAGHGGLASLASSLAQLGVDEGEQRQFLAATALALRGFAGMTRQLEERPDRAPTHALPASLVDFFAVRLLLERAALGYAARTVAELRGPLTRLRERLRAGPSTRPRTVAERAWPLFHLAQLSGFDGARIDEFDAAEVAALERELDEFDGLARRELLHLAYERHLRRRFHDALLEHPPAAIRDAPSFQAVFCIDEREESFRRHLEEIEPAVETFGVAGFFGVSMYYQGAGDAHPRPLSPVALRPEHYVAERGEDSRLRRWRRRGLGLIDKNIQLGSHTLVRGAIVMTAIGALAIVPLVLRVLFPWLRPRVARLELPLVAVTPTRLALERSPEPAPLGCHAGYELDEMVAIVAAQLENIGVVGRLAPLVFVIGHGSISLNNPHESAHDCGACGGGRGGPNARALAQMANDPRVRERLAARGLVIPERTWFVGGERNTADNSLTLFDLDAIPEHAWPGFEAARRSLEAARRREAHERCRRFEAARLGLSPRAALRHVEGRAADLAQPRPEYGHASNALCFVGRRIRTRGLFLDRRAFLVSYDPTRDDDGRILARLLGAGVPVIAGINLEYYFSYVDPTGYGSGTKLPHNVTGLLGVMDGAQSDLRTGLPWQMVEIHEPVRTSVVVEARPELLARVIEADAALAGLIRRRWLFLACLDPDSNRLWEYDGERFEVRESEGPVPLVHGDSRAVYRGKRGHLPFTRIVAPAESELESETEVQS